MENILWGFALLFLLLFGTMVGLIMRYHSLSRRYVKLEEWAEDWLKRLEVKTKDAGLKAENADRRSLLAEEKRLQRENATIERFEKLEARADRLDKYIDDVTEKMGSRLEELETMLPKNSRGEVVRNEILLQQLNDEMERGLKIEKDWNDGVAAILNYGKPKTEVI